MTLVSHFVILPSDEGELAQSSTSFYGHETSQGQVDFDLCEHVLLQLQCSTHYNYICKLWENHGVHTSNFWW